MLAFCASRRRYRHQSDIRGTAIFTLEVPPLFQTLPIFIWTSESPPSLGLQSYHNLKKHLQLTPLLNNLELPTFKDFRVTALYKTIRVNANYKSLELSPLIDRNSSLPPLTYRTFRTTLTIRTVHIEFQHHLTTE